MTLPRFFRLLALALCALVLGACASPKAACPAEKLHPGDPFSGNWAGTWKSAQTGHQGRLEGLFTKIDRRHYRADFKAHWGFLSGRYSVVFETRRAGRKLHFHGQHDLGKLYGGLYKYEGRTTPEHFSARYQSADDHGDFELSR